MAGFACLVSNLERPAKLHLISSDVMLVLDDTFGRIAEIGEATRAWRGPECVPGLPGRLTAILGRLIKHYELAFVNEGGPGNDGSGLCLISRPRTVQEAIICH